MASLPSTHQTNEPNELSKLPVLAKPTSAKKIAELQKASGDLAKLDFNEPGRILKWAGQMDLMGSSALVGFLGGAVGSTAGVTLGGITLAGFSLPAIAITGPLGMMAGIAIAILGWRGRARWNIEKRLSNNRLLLAEVDERMTESLKQIKALPAKTPDTIRREMWNAHFDLVKQRRAIENSIADVEPATSGPHIDTEISPRDEEAG